jgi:predicted Holliday junction resolvase-like endonuclease
MWVNILLYCLGTVAIVSSAFLIAIHKLNTFHAKKLQKARQDAIKRSKANIRGIVSEELVPMFEGFPYSTGDLKLYGKPIDYIVFDGMSEFRDENKEKEITIVFADLKTGKAVKTPVQKAIQKAIEEGRIRFEEWRIDENNKLKIK